MITIAKATAALFDDLVGMMVMMSTFTAHDSINLNAQYAEGGGGQDGRGVWGG